jgi:hypothetical protein
MLLYYPPWSPTNVTQPTGREHCELVPHHIKNRRLCCNRFEIAGKLFKLALLLDIFVNRHRARRRRLHVLFQNVPHGLERLRQLLSQLAHLVGQQGVGG